MPLLRRTSPFALLSLIVAGCGGGSGHGTSTATDPTARVGPQVAIAWPAQTRDIAAPEAAVAARIVFPGSGANGADASQVVSRPVGSAAITKTYLVGLAIQPGTRVLRVDFLANVGDTAALATATVNVVVQKDGTLRGLDGKPLGTVGFDSNVTAVAIAPNQTLEVGTGIELSVTATTPGGVVALRPGAATFAVATGGGFLRANADGSLTGVAPGVATVVPTVEGVTGPAAAVVVLAAPVASRTVLITTSDAVYDPTRGLMWLALPPDAANGNSVQSLDPATGNLGTPIPVGASPTVVAISDDGSTLYAGLFGALAVRRVDLTTNTAGAQFAVTANGPTDPGFALDLAVQPGSNSVVAITPSSVTGGADGPAIYDNGVARPNRGGYSQGNRVTWIDPARLVTYYGDTTLPYLYEYAVALYGVLQTRSLTTGVNDARRRLELVGNRLYDRSGVILDATSLGRLGAFSLGSSSNRTAIYGPAVDPTARRAYFIEIELDGTGYLRVFDTETFAQVSERRIKDLNAEFDVYQSVESRVTRFGATGLLIRLANKIEILDDVSGS